jgi:hypothetical protein
LKALARKKRESAPSFVHPEGAGHQNGAHHNYRGMAEKMHWRGGGPMSPLAARFGALIFVTGGVFAISFAIHRFIQAGY